MLFGLSHALVFAATTAKKSSGISPFILIYLVFIGGLYYFFIRPRNKKMKAQRQETKKVDVGQRAQTIGGFVGTVVKSEADLITLRTDAGVELEFIPAAIARRFDPIVAIPESTDDDGEHPTEGDAQ
jgi:preprotein translocase YajC subunit